MPDAVLTSLCGVCHLVTPRYTCPRCALRSCSSACVAKHKVWASCSGVRDATKYLPPRTLRSAWGVDHEYNYIRAIERTMEQAEKQLVDERGLLHRAELVGETVLTQTKTLRNRDGTRRVVKTARVYDPKTKIQPRRLAHSLADRLRRSNTQVDFVTTGMRRHVENKTSHNRRTNSVNWQVEWLVVAGGGADKVGGEEDDEDNNDNEDDEEDEEKDEEDNAIKYRRPRTTRLLDKVLDHVPLWQAFHYALEEHDDKKRQADEAAAPVSSWDRLARTLNPAAHAAPKPGMQNMTCYFWAPPLVSVQDPFASTWHACPGTMPKWPSEDERDKRAAYRYLLARPYQRDDRPLEVTELSEDDVLREVLRGARVLEYPTIYCVPRETELAHGFVLVDKAASQRGVRRAGWAGDYSHKEEQGTSRPTAPKRPWADNSTRGQERGGRGRKMARMGNGSGARRPDHDREEGEIDSDEEEGEVVDRRKSGRRDAKPTWKRPDAAASAAVVDHEGLALREGEVVVSSKNEGDDEESLDIDDHDGDGGLESGSD